MDFAGIVKDNGLSDDRNCQGLLLSCLEIKQKEFGFDGIEFALPEAKQKDKIEPALRAGPHFPILLRFLMGGSHLDGMPVRFLL